MKPFWTVAFTVRKSRPIPKAHGTLFRPLFAPAKDKILFIAPDFDAPLEEFKGPE